MYPLVLGISTDTRTEILVRPLPSRLIMEGMEEAKVGHCGTSLEGISSRGVQKMMILASRVENGGGRLLKKVGAPRNDDEPPYL